MTKQEQEMQAQIRLQQARMKAHIENMKKECELMGVKASYWENQVKVMHFSMEYEKLLPEYEAHQERMKARDAEMEKKKQEAFQKLNDALAMEQEVKDNLPDEILVTSGDYNDEDDRVPLPHTLDVENLR